jgi:hypothetical protein
MTSPVAVGIGREFSHFFLASVGGGHSYNGKTASHKTGTISDHDIVGLTHMGGVVPIARGGGTCEHDTFTGRGWG